MSSDPKHSPLVAALLGEPGPMEVQRTERIAALLLTIPGWARNYTATIEAAKWMIAEAERVGWRLVAADSRQMDFGAAREP